MPQLKSWGLDWGVLKIVGVKIPTSKSNETPVCLLHNKLKLSLTVPCFGGLNFIRYDDPLFIGILVLFGKYLTTKHLFCMLAACWNVLEPSV